MSRFPARVGFARMTALAGLAWALGLAAFVPSTALASPGRSAPNEPPVRTPAKSGQKSSSRPARGGDAAARRAIAGGPTADDASMGPESAELRALRDAERELFSPASPAPGHPWPPDIAPMTGSAGGPRVEATGLPPASSLPTVAADGTSLAWLAHLELPDIPVRWDERVVRYLQYFRDDPRGHSTFATLYRHSGRWREMIRRALRRKAMPEDLAWVSMIESGFDTTARSTSGASGLWQFMPETAKIYGLVLDRWLDERLNPTVATEAAVDFLGDLHRRFGSWELALAGFNMGYVGLSSVVRRYNTNDFWALARTEGTLPWETTLYVPKIIAAAVVAHNLATFGFGDLTIDAPIESDTVDVPPGTPLTLVAQAAGCTPKDLETLNPELRAGRTPPAVGAGSDASSATRRGAEATDAGYPVRVPVGKGQTATQALARLRRDQPPLERYVVRFGETLEQVASAHKVSVQKLVELNAIAPGETLRGGTVLLVPHVDGACAEPPSRPAGPAAPSADSGAKPTVVVPADLFVYPDRKRVFYRVRIGDNLREIAAALRVAPDDLWRWNALDASARLQEGMTLQAFVPEDADLSRVVTVGENDVQVLPVGSDEFFAALERDKGFRRVTVLAKAGDTVESIGRRFDVSPKTMERINRRPRRDTLKAGEACVVYVSTPHGASGATHGGALATGAPAAASGGSGALPSVSDAAALGPLPAPPLPDLLP